MIKKNNNTYIDADLEKKKHLFYLLRTPCNTFDNGEIVNFVGVEIERPDLKKMYIHVFWT